MASSASPAPVDWVARARALAPVVEKQAQASEQAGTLTRPVVDALGAAGLFGLALPRALGGAEEGFETQLAVWEEVSTVGRTEPPATLRPVPPPHAANARSDSTGTTMNTRRFIVPDSCRGFGSSR